MLLRLSKAVVRTILATPPVPRVVPDSVFDGFGWCPSDILEWRRPDAWAPEAEVSATNPAGMIFVIRERNGAPGTAESLPRELARLHAPGLGLDGEWALAPYAIDDATDQLYEKRVAPGSVLWLAATDLPGLVWGLHDWAHFHSHGPFVARAMTELQCDLTALVWLRLNRRAIGIDDATCELARRRLSRVARDRFEEEGAPVPEDCLSADLVSEVECGLTSGRAG
jgi:hypothetical protein